MKLFLLAITGILLFNLVIMEAQACNHHQSEVLSSEVVSTVTITGDFDMTTVFYLNNEFQVVRKGLKNTRLRCLDTGETMKVPTADLTGLTAEKGVISKPGAKKEMFRKDAMVAGPSIKIDTKPGPVRNICPTDRQTVLSTIPYGQRLAA